ncbi:hypothetical protein [Sphingobium aquiterrae]|uniref:hypothetical protein n=1 Tax=Sphingobium aquiterrae TaxID=2038656 RepID=UPI003019D943
MSEAKGHFVRAKGVTLPVGGALGSVDASGISFAAKDGSIYISITDGGDGLTVCLQGDMIDHVAGMFADMVFVANADDIAANVGPTLQ